MSLEETTQDLIKAAREQAETNRDVIKAIQRVGSIMTLMQQDVRMNESAESAISLTSLSERIAILEVRIGHLMEIVRPLKDLPSQITALSKDAGGNTKAQDRITGVVVSVITAAIIALVMAQFK